MSSSVAAPARLRALPLDVCVHTAAFCKTGQEGAAEFFLLNQPVISDLAAILNVTMVEAANLKIKKYYRDMRLAFDGKLRDPATGERVGGGGFLTKATEEDPQIMEAFRIVMEEFTRSEGPKFKRKVRASELERQRKEGVIDDEEYASKKQKLWREEEEALADLEGA
jgi:hypothetical protein